MKKISEQLQNLVSVSYNRMKKMPDEDWNYRRAAGKWSKKEILGHLIDSASNNHQRFIRAQFGDKTPISYDGAKWVKVQDYNDEEVKTNIELWANYNMHLAYVILKIPADKYDVLFSADAKDLVTLQWIVKDYIRHLEHHLEQILL